MDNRPSTKEQLNKELWEMKVYQFDIDETKREALLILGNKFSSNINAIYNLYRILINNIESYTFADENFEYLDKDDICKLTLDNKNYYFAKEILKDYITFMIDIFQNILPLGSVVNLKKEYLPKELQAAPINEFQMVITHRYLLPKSGPGYYTYGGVVYPVGNMGRKDIFQFTPTLIEQVVFAGYSDYQEDLYVYTMKKELIVERGKHSLGFALLHDINQAKKQQSAAIQENNYTSFQNNQE